MVAAQNPGTKKKDIDEWLDIFLDGITTACVVDDGVRFMGFGTFVVKEYDAKMARNPKTMEDAIIPQHREVRFRVGEKLKVAIN